MPSNRSKDFISEIKTQGLSRTNRFTVEMTPPGAAPAVTRRILLFCEQASLPGINYATTQNRSYGEVREIPYDKLYDNITLQFHVDKDFHVKKVFDQWLHYIQHPVSRSFEYYNNYVTPMTVEIQDLNDKSTYQIQFFEAYPKAMTAIQLDAEAKDTMRLQVTFQYKYWSSNKLEQLGSGHKLSSDDIDKYKGDFTGFQARFQKGLGEAGNFLTGAVGQVAMRSFSQVTSRIPSIKF
jgi:hypothetical protein